MRLKTLKYRDLDNLSVQLKGEVGKGTKGHLWGGFMRVNEG